jgi:hypothetical protein
VVAEWLQLVLKSPGPLRLLYYVDGLHTDRTCTPQDAWMNSPVPRRSDDVRNYLSITRLISASKSVK